MRLLSALLTVLLLCQLTYGNRHQTVDVEDNDFAEFEDFDDGMVCHSLYSLASDNNVQNI